MGAALGRGYHCVMLGLDGSGKTTIFNRLKYGQYTNTYPTIGFNSHKIQSNGSYFHLWDVGGQDKTRPLWRSYTRCTDAIIFVVDSSDKDRMEEAKLELLNILKMTERTSIPIMVLANKQDLPKAVTEDRISSILSLKTGDSLVIRSSCGVTGEGLERVFHEVKHLVQKNRKLKNVEKSKVLFRDKIHRSLSQHFL